MKPFVLALSVGAFPCRRMECQRFKRGVKDLPWPKPFSGTGGVDSGLPGSDLDGTVCHPDAQRSALGLPVCPGQQPLEE